MSCILLNVYSSTPAFHFIPVFHSSFQRSMFSRYPNTKQNTKTKTRSLRTSTSRNKQIVKCNETIGMRALCIEAFLFLDCSLFAAERLVRCLQATTSGCQQCDFVALCGLWPLTLFTYALWLTVCREQGSWEREICNGGK